MGKEIRIEYGKGGRKGTYRDDYYDSRSRYNNDRRNKKI